MATLATSDSKITEYEKNLNILPLFEFFESNTQLEYAKKKLKKNMDSYQQINKLFTPNDHKSIIKSQKPSVDSRNSSKEGGQQDNNSKQFRLPKPKEDGQQQQQQPDNNSVQCSQTKNLNQNKVTTTRRLPAALRAGIYKGADSKQHNKPPTVTKYKAESITTRKQNPFKKMSDCGDEETTEVIGKGFCNDKDTYKPNNDEDFQNEDDNNNNKGYKKRFNGGGGGRRRNGGGRGGDSRNSSKEGGQQDNNSKQFRLPKPKEDGQQQQQQPDNNSVQCSQPKNLNQNKVTTTRRLPAALRAGIYKGTDSKQHNEPPTVTKSEAEAITTRKQNPFKKKMSDLGDEETTEVINGGGGRGRNGGGRGGGRNENGFNRYNKDNDDNEENGGESNVGYGGERRNGGFGGGRSRGGGGGGGRDGGRREFNNKKGANEHNNSGGRGEGADGEEPQKPREFYIPPEPTENEDEIFGSGITSGINFSKYDSIPVKVTGENPPDAIQSFEEANMRDIVINNIKRSGYTIPTPIQKTAIPVITSGRDLMACAQTGSGKTAAFLLPIINSLLSEGAETSIGRPHALVVSPTRELAIQIFNEARKFALGSYLNIRIVYGGTSTRHQGENIGRGGSHILICTPGRLLDFVEKGFITFEDIRFVVLDEADRMLDMGFKESMATIMNHPTMRPMEKRQNLMFSATFPAEIQRMAGEYLNEYIFIAVGVVGGACTDVTQNIYEVKKFQKRSALMKLLQENPDGTIVFAETKRGADFLASLLSETDFPTTSIHGDRLQSQREMALSDFKNGKMKVLIATSVAARGLDIKNVKHVVNYDMPSSIDEYVHRIGRTGRVGNNGRATSFFDPESDSAIATDLVNILEGAGQEVPEFLKKLGGLRGGGGSYGSKFGGRDVRKGVAQTDDNFVTSSGPSALEDDESWN